MTKYGSDVVRVHDFFQHHNCVCGRQYIIDRPCGGTHGDGDHSTVQRIPDDLVDYLLVGHEDIHGLRSVGAEAVLREERREPFRPRRGQQDRPHGDARGEQAFQHQFALGHERSVVTPILTLYVTELVESRIVYRRDGFRGEGHDGASVRGRRAQAIIGCSMNR